MWWIYLAGGFVLFVMGYALCALMASAKIGDMQGEFWTATKELQEKLSNVKKELAQARIEKRKLRKELDYVQQQFQAYRTRVRDTTKKINDVIDDKENDPSYNLKMMEGGL